MKGTHAELSVANGSVLVIHERQSGRGNEPPAG